MQPVTQARRPVFPLVLANNRGTLPYLPLGMVAAYLRVHNEGALATDYAIQPLLPGGPKPHPLNALYDTLEAHPAPVCLLSSYVWNEAINLRVAKRIRRDFPGALILIGGPQVPRFNGDTEAFMAEHPFIDVAVLGEGELACAEILEALAGQQARDLSALAKVTGLVYRDDETITRTAERQRLKDINVLPSPYLSGEFGSWFDGLPTAILETNRGCPYGCTYCDWGSATLQKVTRFDPQRVIAEVEYMAEHKARSIFIADANFGMLEQDIEIAEGLVAIRERLGYPQRLYTNFAKNGGRRLMSVIRILHRGGLLPNGVIALQTTDPVVLKAIKRDNIRTASYEKMMEYFNGENIPMSSDLMIGLPGQTVDSLAADLQFCFDWKVSANGNYTSMMPNAPMNEADYRSEHMIATDEEGLISATSSFTADDMAQMKALFMVYQLHVSLGLARYLLYYLQLEHAVPAIALLRRWLDAVRREDPAMPLAARVWRELIAMDSRSGDWALLSWTPEAGLFFQQADEYLAELLTFVQREYTLDLPASVRETLIGAQQAVMPNLERQYPIDQSLPHDLAAYIAQIKQVPCLDRLDEGFQPLQSFGPANLNVSADTPRIDSLHYQKLDAHSDGWELASALRFY